MAKAFLPVGVETRLKAQREIWHRLAMSDEKEKQATQSVPFVTISRQYGCMAYALADGLAQRLDAEFPEWNFTIYDRKTLEMMAENESIKADVAPTDWRIENLRNYPERASEVSTEIVKRAVLSTERHPTNLYAPPANWQ